MTLETRQGNQYINAFKEKYPNAIQIISNPFTTFSEMNEMSAWGKENLLFDALITLKGDYYKNYSKEVYMIWHLTNDVDVMAVKLRWT